MFSVIQTIMVHSVDSANSVGCTLTGNFIDAATCTCISGFHESTDGKSCIGSIIC